MTARRGPGAPARVAVAPEVVRSDGLAIAAYRFGGAGPPLVLVHATGFHAHCWLPLLDTLRKEFAVFAFDLRGHGESETPAEPDLYAFDRLSADFAAVARHFGLETFHAVGHSVGGAVIVGAELARPGTVRRAVLFEPIILPPELTGESPATATARARRVAFASTDEMVSRWTGRAPFGAFDPAALRAYVEYGVRDRPDGTVTLKCTRAAEVATFLQDRRSGLWPRLGDYATPTLVLVGGRSTSRIARATGRMVGAMRAARLEEEPALSHFLPFEDPARMARRAVDFLSSWKGSTGVRSIPSRTLSS